MIDDEGKSWADLVADMPDPIRDAIVDSFEVIDERFLPLFKAKDGSGSLALFLLVIGLAERIKEWPMQRKRDLLTAFGTTLGANVVHQTQPASRIWRRGNHPRRPGRGHR